MRSLNELTDDELKIARDAAATVINLKPYLPRGGLLLMLLGRWRDEVGDALGITRGELPRRASECRPVDQLTTAELEPLSDAVTTLTELRFTATMDDPELARQLHEFGAALDDEKTDRAQIQASITS